MRGNIGLTSTLLLAAWPLAACGVSPFGTATPTASRTTAHATFSACPRTAPAPGTTDLAPVARTDATNAEDPPAPAMPFGTVVLEQPAVLHLDGTIGAGGSEAAMGFVDFVTVSDRPVDAPVTLAVLDSPTAGRRVAFAEVKLLPSTPVRWVELQKLDIGTDGGDGGFVAGHAPEANDWPTDAYVSAYDMDHGGVCVLRRTAGATQPDVVAFSTGYGDGGYPTFAGYDASDRIASLVNFGYVLPWRYSGLPGAPPTSPEVGAIPYASMPPSARPSA